MIMLYHRRLLQQVHLQGQTRLVKSHVVMGILHGLCVRACVRACVWRVLVLT